MVNLHSLYMSTVAKRLVKKSSELTPSWTHSRQLASQLVALAPLLHWFLFPTVTVVDPRVSSPHSAARRVVTVLCSISHITEGHDQIFKPP